ncbi:MAG: topoisomerase DNA-binding C4 zinc finger domain-containing protein [Clostridia bacterium]|nr:topoisomerase DNA-binding C4 zinc finger domain-containing protein [Clostridia bacterium]
MEKIQYALKDDKLCCIDEVESGLKCGCVCPACGGVMVARKGDIKIHHFAHKSKVVCEHGLETSLHLLAKQILKDVKTFMLPSIKFRDHGCVVIEEKRSIKIVNVELEKYINDIKPDILMVDEDGNKYCVEIYVTHAIDNEKLEKIIKLKLNTIQINLSDFANKQIGYDFLREILICETNKKEWKYHSKIEEKKNELAVPVIKLKNCVFQQKRMLADFIYCLTHCKYGVGMSKDDSEVYCTRANEVLAGYKISDKPKYHNDPECGCKLEVVREGDRFYYKCTGYPVCDYKENIESVYQTLATGETCPICKSKMVLRTGKNGKFLGCERWPQCSYTKNL